MLKHTLLLTIMILTSCGQGEKAPVTPNTAMSQTIVPEKENKVDKALAFINAYVENSNKLNKAVGVIDWVNTNSLTTQSFKTELTRIIDDAYQRDPELGLDADPIFDAQDNPGKGFELESFDENTNYLIVRGKDWKEFKLTMKVVQDRGDWLVDGCGMVNIPNHKRLQR